MRKHFPSFVGDGFDNSTLNMRTFIIVVKNDVILFSWLFGLYLFAVVYRVALTSLLFTAYVELPFAIFVRTPPPLTLIIHIHSTMIS